MGLGPLGLFAALALAEAGVPVTVLERGQPVEGRGRDIGALFARRVLNSDEVPQGRRGRSRTASSRRASGGTATTCAR